MRIAPLEQGGDELIRGSDLQDARQREEHGSSRMSAPVSLNYSQTLRRDGAFFYLSEIARGFLKGEIVLHFEGRRYVIPASEIVDVEIDLQERKRACKIEVKVSWVRLPAVVKETQQKAG